MSLIVYTKKSQFSKEDFILDVNSSFRSCSFSGTDFCKRVISGIDRGTYLDDMSFIDRFGYRLYSKFLSTTSKALICLDEFPEKVVNFCEAGNNIGNFILEKTDGRVYIPKGRIKYVLSGYGGEHVDVEIDEKHFENIEDMYWYLEEEYV